LTDSRLNALGEALDEIFPVSGGGLVSDRVDDAEHVLSAMIDFAHEELFLFLTLLTFGNVLNSTAEAYDPSVSSGTCKKCESMSVHPADLALSPLPKRAWRTVAWREGNVKLRSRFARVQARAAPIRGEARCDEERCSSNCPRVRPLAPSTGSQPSTRTCRSAALSISPMIPEAMQSWPTAVGNRGELSDTEP
jgi:hypothetical protein